MKICLCSSLPLRQCIKLIVKICSFHNSTIQIVPTRDYLQQFLGAMSSNPTFDIFCFVEYHEEYNYDNSTNELRICSYQLFQTNTQWNKWVFLSSAITCREFDINSSWHHGSFCMLPCSTTSNLQSLTTSIHTKSNILGSLDSLKSNYVNTQSNALWPLRCDRSCFSLNLQTWSVIYQDKP